MSPVVSWKLVGVASASRLQGANHASKKTLLSSMGKQRMALGCGRYCWQLSPDSSHTQVVFNISVHKVFPTQAQSEPEQKLVLLRFQHI
jgi:hypothetical protein